MATVREAIRAEDGDGQNTRSVWSSILAWISFGSLTHFLWLYSMPPLHLHFDGTLGALDRHLRCPIHSSLWCSSLLYLLKVEPNISRVFSDNLFTNIKGPYIQIFWATCTLLYLANVNKSTKSQRVCGKTMSGCRYTKEGQRVICPKDNNRNRAQGNARDLAHFRI